MSSLIIFKIINISDLKETWDLLKMIYLEVSQRAVYLIL